MALRRLPRKRRKRDGPFLAFDNQEFLHSSIARDIRVLCEFVEPRHRLGKHRIRDTVVFFGSARSKSRKEARRALREAEGEARGRRRSPEVGRRLERARTALAMSKYYEDAARLARMITEWSHRRPDGAPRLVVCSGGGGGIMEAANLGASLAGGKSIGFNIELPFEQRLNPYITPGLGFEFHYFFIRKFWFIYLAKAVIFFPGGFGTLDELMETLTLIQTDKLEKRLPVIIYGRSFWEEVVDFGALVRHGTISEEDLELFRFCETPREAFRTIITEVQAKHPRFRDRA